MFLSAPSPRPRLSVVVVVIDNPRLDEQAHTQAAPTTQSSSARPTVGPLIGASRGPISSSPTTANFRASPTKVSAGDATGTEVSDLRPSTTTADVAPKEVSPSTEANQTDKCLDDLRASCPRAFSSTRLVEPAVWLEIKIDHQERLRLEYIWSSKEIVTWPTWVHETFDVSLSCFKAIAAADPDTYSCLYNKNFRLFNQDDKAADLIPDFALARYQDSGP
ncbi:hypothetical protein B0H16DRAFT_1729858 [Mycena metata]|uniref:Uncharacterized protein n=1 Tax=Mycena metata TaxID=1033252 RepID=A0AAD7N0C2_9AGAR|nr:hypothetical protein B0H16DRAFT_1729858 [Mycena metata]